MLVAVHILWWESLIFFTISKTDFCVSSVELYNRYRYYYETIIFGVLAYIFVVIPEKLFKQPELLIHSTKDHNNCSVVELLAQKYIKLCRALTFYCRVLTCCLIRS